MTTSNTVLGQWPEAPLAMVLAQIRFESFLKIEDVAGPFRERIEASHPRVQPFHVIQLPVPAPDGAPAIAPQMILAGYDFCDAGKTKCVRLNAESLTYFVTAYAKYDGHFEEEWATLVASLAATKDLFVTRAGLRYLDFIIPAVGGVPADYIQAPVGRVPTVPNGTPTIAFNLVQYAMPGGGMRIQYAESTGRPELPADLHNIQLAPPPIMTREFTGLAAVLDTDCWVEPNQLLDLAAIKRAFSKIHADMSAAFRGMITARAFKEWAQQ